MTTVCFRKRKAQAANSTFLPPTQEMINTREAIAAAETALTEMSEIIASYPIKTLNNKGSAGQDKSQNQSAYHDSSHESSKYEDMLRIKAYSVACLQDLKTCFDSVQAEYLRSRAS